MHPARRLVWFFYLFPPAHPIARIGLGSLAAIAPLLILLRLTDAAAFLLPLVVLQSLAAASGFTGPARRGHYDMLFTMGYRRMTVGMTHWLLSIAGGLAVWLAIALAEWFAGGTPAARGFEAVAAMAMASSVPWAITVPLPRLSGGVATVVLASFAASFGDGAPWQAVATMVATHGPAVALIAAGAGLGAVMVALRVISKADVPLEAAQ